MTTMMPVVKHREKALSALRDGRVRVFCAVGDATHSPCRRVMAAVQTARPGNDTRYIVDLLDGRWYCTCPTVMRDGTTVCAHIAAVQLITGWPSPAAKP